MMEGDASGNHRGGHHGLHKKEGGKAGRLADRERDRQLHEMTNLWEKRREEESGGEGAAQRIALA